MTHQRQDSVQDEPVDHDVEQAALRALNRMGSHKAKPSSSPSSSGERPKANDQLRLSPRPAQDSSGQFRKRRFVRDGDIPVEHNPFSRAPARATLSVSGDSDTKVANRALENEKRARAEAERLVHELEMSHRSLETRLGHAEVLVSELKQALATRDMELAERTVELENERAAVKLAHAEIKAFRQQTKSTSVKPKSGSNDAEIAVDEDGQQPIKWWKD
ncbi:hypothetical protein [Acetobacter conturbans]|nr:hypothetical protein [Acetobacter conturbans]